MLQGGTWKQCILYFALQGSLTNLFLKSCWQGGLTSAAVFGCNDPTYKVFGCNDPIYNSSSVRLFIILVASFVVARGLGIALVLSSSVTTPLITPVILSKWTWHFCLSFGCDIPTYYPSLPDWVFLCTFLVLIFFLFCFIFLFFVFFLFSIIFITIIVNFCLGKLVLITAVILHPCYKTVFVILSLPFSGSLTFHQYCTNNTIYSSDRETGVFYSPSAHFLRE